MDILDFDGSGTESEMYAYVAIDENGMAGICAGQTPVGMTPFVSMTLEGMAKWKPYVEGLREATGKPIHLVRYAATEIIQ